MVQASFLDAKNKRCSLWPIIALAGIVLFLAFLAWKIVDGYERAYRTTYRPIISSQGNPYFVAGEYLKKQGKKISWHGKDNANSAFKTLTENSTNTKGQLLIIDSLSDIRHTDAIDKLILWIKAGGHVMVYATERLDKTSLDMLDDDDKAQYNEIENPLLTALGIYWLSLPSKVDYDNKGYHFLTDCGTLLQVDGKLLKALGACGQLQVANGSEFVPFDYHALAPTMTYQDVIARLGKPKDDQQAQAFANFLTTNPAQYSPANALLDGKLGQGRLTVLTNNQIFNNPIYEKIDSTNITPTTPQTLWEKLPHHTSNMVYQGGIADNDHAFLLHFLSKNAKEVWFFANLERPTFWDLLKEQFAFGLLALALMMIAMVLALPRQFGRQAQVLDDSGQNVVRYFEQVGQYFWQVDNMKKQVATNRTALKKRLVARIAYLSLLTNDPTDMDDEHMRKWCVILAETLGLDEQVVFLALFADWGSRAEFIKISQALVILETRFSEH